MRGKKSYNIRNIEAHLNTPKIIEQPIFHNNNFINRNLVFQTNTPSNQNNQYYKANDYINAKFGVSKYASNLVSGKMFKQLL